MCVCMYPYMVIKKINSKLSKFCSVPLSVYQRCTRSMEKNYRKTTFFLNGRFLNKYAHDSSC